MLAFMPSPSDMGVVMVVAVLLFGKRLPEIARQVGRGMSELKKGMMGIQSELNSAIYSNDTQMSSYSSTPARPTNYYNDVDDRDEQTAPKFEPPPAEPTVGETTSPSSRGI